MGTGGSSAAPATPAWHLFSFRGPADRKYLAQVRDTATGQFYDFAAGAFDAAPKQPLGQADAIEYAVASFFALELPTELPEGRYEVVVYWLDPQQAQSADKSLPTDWTSVLTAPAPWAKWLTVHLFATYDQQGAQQAPMPNPQSWAPIQLMGWASTAKG